MKKTLIDEILEPLEDFKKNAKLGSYDRNKLLVVISDIRGDLDKVFGDLFDPEFYGSDNLSDESFMAGADDDFLSSSVFGSGGDKDCPLCGGDGRTAVPFGPDDFEYEPCQCVENGVH